MIAAIPDPTGLLDEQLLTVEEAVAWLAERGIETSRFGLYRLRAEGSLPTIRTRGRKRIKFRPSDLARAFVEGEEKWPSSSSGGSRAETGSSAASSREKAFMKALERVSAASPRRRGSA